jgi:hypothetical protein
MVVSRLSPVSISAFRASSNSRTTQSDLLQTIKVGNRHLCSFLFRLFRRRVTRSDVESLLIWVAVRIPWKLWKPRKIFAGNMFFWRSTKFEALEILSRVCRMLESSANVAYRFWSCQCNLQVDEDKKSNSITLATQTIASCGPIHLLSD